MFDKFKRSDLTDEQVSDVENEQVEKELCNFVRNSVEEIRGQASRIAHEGIWMTNIAYLLGYDGIAFNSSTRQFQPVNRASAYLKKNRLHVNKILPTIQNRLARLCKNPPKFDVAPESNDTEDKEAARLGQQVLGSLWNKLSLSEKRLWLYMWVQQTGHAYMKVFWDAGAGNLYPHPETGEFDFEGEIGTEICSPFELFPNPLAKSFEDVKRSYITQCKVRPLDYYPSQYKEKGSLVKPEECWLLSLQYDQRINSINSRGPAQGGMSSEMKNSAIEMIRYEAPSRERPRGRMICVSNGILLDDKELPCGEIPFAKFDDIIIGGKYNSESVITHLRPVQDHFNETVRRRSEWTRKLLAGKYKAARGSGLNQESLNDESGEVVYYDPVPNAPQGPEAMQVPMIPQWAYTEEDRATGHLNDISGISEVSRGQLPSASIPAIGMQLLTEQDDTRIGVMTEQHEHSWARVGMLMLKYVEKYYIMPRKLKIAGRDLEYTVKEIKGEDLNGNTDVTVIRGSTLPGSKTLRRQEIMNALQTGLLGNPQDPATVNKVLDLMEFGDVQGIWQDFGLDMAQIRKAIDALEKGTPVQPSEFDNHALFLIEMNRYRKGDKFLSLDPQKQQNFVQTMDMFVHAMMVKNNMVPPPVNPQDVANKFDTVNPGPPPMAGPPPPEGAPPQ